MTMVQPLSSWVTLTVRERPSALVLELELDRDPLLLLLLLEELTLAEPCADPSPLLVELLAAVPFPGLRSATQLRTKRPSAR